ncbi:MAG: hypothetical protein MZW92_81320 [Comamonadaceae bacterium]|nr:hypothetical protein [Comamonadaceae bacterium]
MRSPTFAGASELSHLTPAVGHRPERPAAPRPAADHRPADADQRCSAAPATRPSACIRR